MSRTLGVRRGTAAVVDHGPPVLRTAEGGGDGRKAARGGGPTLSQAGGNVWVRRTRGDPRVGGPGTDGSGGGGWERGREGGGGGKGKPTPGPFPSGSCRS